MGDADGEGGFVLGVCHADWETECPAAVGVSEAEGEAARVAVGIARGVGETMLDDVTAALGELDALVGLRSGIRVAVAVFAWGMDADIASDAVADNT